MDSDMTDGSSKAALGVARAAGAPIIELKHVTVDFHAPAGFRKPRTTVRAVDDVSLGVANGQTLGLVGVTGSGKSTIAHLVMGMAQPTQGSILIDGADPSLLSGRALRDQRRLVQVVLQDPYSSLDPRMKVQDLIAEPLTLGGRRSKEVTARVEELLALVSLPPTTGGLYPHQFSGGQRQRIAIARALAPSPKIVVLDEPTSALDVSVRAQIINLLNALQDGLGVTYLVISHDLITVAGLASTVAVMYPGRIVEIGPTMAILRNPQHPYTLQLQQSAPSADGAFLKVRQPDMIGSRTEGVWRSEEGCRFRTRCALAAYLGDPARCRTEEPELHEVSPGHEVACHFSDQTGALAARARAETASSPLELALTPSGPPAAPSAASTPTA
jgi:oligopeptide/dipeptide ABC transporter ATP-binding protein